MRGGDTRRGDHPVARRFAVGAEPDPRGVSFRVWAPTKRSVRLLGPGRPATELEPEPDGFWSLVTDRYGTGDRYGFSLDGSARLADPASRFQPEGPHGWSEIVDPDGFAWTDTEWAGSPRTGQVMYEMHVRTFTPDGTLASAARELPRLADLGITIVELMPLADFPGRFGWGYDGVCWWAPTRLYGRPDDLRAFVDRAHQLGLGVLLDVVYNHVGPEGSVLAAFADAYFTDRYDNEWGRAINFDGPESGPVRELVIENAVYWITEFHLDGLRLDATQQIFDASSRHVLAELAARVRAAAAPRTVYLVAENEPQQTRLVREPDGDGYGLDALWNDDFHHAAVAALTGRAEAYYSDTPGTPQEILSAVRWGYLYQGQYYQWQGTRRGTPGLDLEATRFVTYLENHDQVANSGRGRRLADRTTPGRLRALTALLLLAPGTPLLFQGQEWATRTPFLFFADLPDLADDIATGRRAFLAQFPSLATPAMQRLLPDPGDPDTVARCVLDPRERAERAPWVALHRDLLRLRRDDPAFAQQRADRMHGAVLGAESFALRFLHEAGDRLLLVNLGPDLRPAPTPEPLLAPPSARGWAILWGSEDPAYDGDGIPPVDTPEGFRMLGHAAVVLEPAPE